MSNFYQEDEEKKNRNKAISALEKAKRIEKKIKLYTYVSPDKRISISHQTKDGLERMKKALGIKD